MKVLIVEDDLDVLEALKGDLDALVQPNNIAWAQSRNAAFQEIKETTFDLAILDLQIPTQDGLLDAEIAHGIAVYSEIRRVSKGTPICFLTAFGTDDFITDLLCEAERVDIWGLKELFPLIQMLPKKRLNEIIGMISNVKEIIDKTDDIEVNIGLTDLTLDHLEKRVLRIFARRHRGASITVSGLSGGMSGSKVIRAIVKDEHGVSRILVAVKISDYLDVQNEIDRYDEEVTRLPHGTFPNLIDKVQAGAGNKGGVFYKLLEGYERTLFDLLDIDESKAVLVLQKLKELQKPWTNDVPTAQMNIRDVRRRLISDEDLENLKDRLQGLAWQEFERRSILVRWCCQHADLHGNNILIGQDEITPILIDFGTVGQGPAALDPLTLEFSFLFHPDGKKCTTNWPSAEALEAWNDLDLYIGNCNIPNFIKETRAWAHSVAAGTREVLATAYAIALRQLKYTDTNKEFALLVAKNSIQSMD